MGTDNAFAELGLAPDATDIEIKAAWRRLVSQWHPDRNSSADAVARMQRINRAFEEIRNAGPRPQQAGTPGFGSGIGVSVCCSRERQAQEARARVRPRIGRGRQQGGEPARTGAILRIGERAGRRIRCRFRQGIQPGVRQYIQPNVRQHVRQHVQPRVRQYVQQTSGNTTSNTTSNTTDTTADAGPHRRPIYRKVKLTLEEAAVGCIKVMQGKITETCAVCAGAGHQVLGGNCAQCGGSGALAKRSFFGWPTGYSECTACLGGGIARRQCKACAGTGKATPQPYKVGVRIPAGVRHGDLLHVDARRASKANAPADLEIRVEFADHEFFRLEDDGTIHCEIPVDGFAWIANRPIQVPTVAGLQSMKLKRDQVSYRLKGHGFPVSRGGPRADQQVTVQPIFPDHLTADQEILLDQLLATTSGDGGPASDKRLRAWNSGLRAWERELSKRAP